MNTLQEIPPALFGRFEETKTARHQALLEESPEADDNDLRGIRYSAVLFGLSAVAAARDFEISPEDLSHLFHDPLCMVVLEESLPSILTKLRTRNSPDEPPKSPHISLPYTDLSKLVTEKELEQHRDNLQERLNSGDLARLTGKARGSISHYQRIVDILEALFGRPLGENHPYHTHISNLQHQLTEFHHRAPEHFQAIAQRISQLPIERAATARPLSPSTLRLNCTKFQGNRMPDSETYLTDGVLFCLKDAILPSKRTTPLSTKIFPFCDEKRPIPQNLGYGYWSGLTESQAIAITHYGMFDYIEPGPYSYSEPYKKHYAVMITKNRRVAFLNPQYVRIIQSHFGKPTKIKLTFMDNTPFAAIFYRRSLPVAVLLTITHTIPFDIDTAKPLLTAL